MNNDDLRNYHESLEERYGTKKDGEKRKENLEYLHNLHETVRKVKIDEEISRKKVNEHKEYLDYIHDINNSEKTTKSL